MPAPIASPVETPWFRTPIVWKAIAIGAIIGVVVTLGLLRLFLLGNPPGEGQNRADVVDAGGEREAILSASSCDVSQAAAVMRDASVPVRFRVKLVRVVDGDTIRVIWLGEETAVRLIGIDAPERGHPGGKEATSCLRGILGTGETVDLKFAGNRPRRDSLGRLLAEVWVGDIHANAEMLRLGHAFPYRKRKTGRANSK